MDKKRIGIYYNVSDSWIGGKYYLDGIINVLKLNDNNEIIFLKRSFFSRVLKKLFGEECWLYKKIYIIKSRKTKLDVVFPYIHNCYTGKKNISWIPDFQENYYPEFFTTKIICNRLIEQTNIAYSNDTLVLSSESAKKDFERLFPKYTCNVEVLSFISSLYGKDFSYEGDVLAKYNISGSFFLCSNQFWKHKNHIVVIKAFNEVVKKNIPLTCVFTGKEEDFRNPDYPQELHNLCDSLNLGDKVKFLGFIPRNDQIELMKKCAAVIQPSLFEGWNTTVEDAKVYNKNIIASAIPVHMEQLKEKGFYFDVEDFNKLADILINSDFSTEKSYDYDQQSAVYISKINSIFMAD